MKRVMAAIAALAQCCALSACGDAFTSANDPGSETASAGGSAGAAGAGGSAGNAAGAGSTGGAGQVTAGRGGAGGNGSAGSGGSQGGSGGSVVGGTGGSGAGSGGAGGAGSAGTGGAGAGGIGGGPDAGQDTGGPVAAQQLLSRPGLCGVASDGASVYFTVRSTSTSPGIGNGMIGRLPVGGGEVKWIEVGGSAGDPCSDPCAITLAGGYVYVADACGFVKRVDSSDAVVKLDTSHLVTSYALSPLFIAVQGSYAYWADTSGLTYRSPVDGSAGPAWYTTACTMMGGLAVDADAVYRTCTNTVVVNQLASPRASSTPYKSPANVALSIAADSVTAQSAHLYLSEGDAADGRVLSLAAPYVAGSVPSPLAAGQPRALNLTLDGSSLYWTVGGAVVVADVASGITRSVSTDSSVGLNPVASALAVNGAHVYWVYNGHLNQAPK